MIKQRRYDIMTGELNEETETVMFGFKKYNVDYCGRKDEFKRARDAYRAGRTVVVFYAAIGTDTDYSFYLDKERLNVTYSGNRGYKIKFKMPAHDIKLVCRSTNSMYVGDLDGPVE